MSPCYFITEWDSLAFFAFILLLIMIPSYFRPQASSCGKQLGNLFFFNLWINSHWWLRVADLSFAVISMRGISFCSQWWRPFNTSPVTGDCVKVLRGPKISIAETIPCPLWVQSLRFSSDGSPSALPQVVPRFSRQAVSAGPGVALHQTRGFWLFNYSRGLRQVLTHSNVLIISPALDFLFENDIFSYWIMHHSGVLSSLSHLSAPSRPDLYIILFIRLCSLYPFKFPALHY